MPIKVWYKITYPFPNFNGCTVDVWEWISYFITHFIMYIVTYPWWHLSTAHITGTAMTTFCRTYGLIEWAITTFLSYFPFPSSRANRLLHPLLHIIITFPLLVRQSCPILNNKYNLTNSSDINNCNMMAWLLVCTSWVVPNMACLSFLATRGFLNQNFTR